MRRIAQCALPVLLAACSASAQPVFEVASIKINDTGGNSSSSNGDKGEVFMKNQTLKRLVERAYNAKPFQVTGPDWLQSVRVDIAAKYPPDSKPEDRPLMLRTLLQERFKLVAHTKTEQMPGYALAVAKGGFKLKPADKGDGGSDTNQNGQNLVTTLTAKRTSMAQLADLISSHAISAKWWWTTPARWEFTISNSSG